MPARNLHLRRSTTSLVLEPPSGRSRPHRSNASARRSPGGYYRDGGWLARAAAGKKTIAWLAVDDRLVRVTFSFAERHRAAFRDASALDSELRDRIEATPLIGKLLPVTIDVRSSADVAVVRAVLAIKLAVR